MLLAQTGLHQTGLQSYKAPLRWRVRGLDLSSLFGGSFNTATGTDALAVCTSCYENVADGYAALYSCTTCWGNVGVGFQALYDDVTGQGNTADSLNFVFSGIDKPKDADQGFYGLRYGDFVPPLVKAVQELSASSNSKDSAINAMQSTIDSLRTQMTGMMAQMAELRAMVQAQKSAAALDQNFPILLSVLRSSVTTFLSGRLRRRCRSRMSPGRYWR